MFQVMFGAFFWILSVPQQQFSLDSIFQPTRTFTARHHGILGMSVHISPNVLLFF